MKVLLINGSPHKKGCTNRALEEIKSTLEKNGIEGEIFHIGKEKHSGCIACRFCRSGKGNAKCIFDDAVNDIIEKLKEYDGLVIGSPVYISSPNGSLISFLDRLFYAAPSEYLRLKPAAAVVSARRAGTTASFDVLNKYFTIREMPVVSSQYWNMVHGNTPAEVEKDKEGLQIMRTLGNNMAWLLNIIKLSEENGIKKPVLPTRTSTNFINNAEDKI